MSILLTGGAGYIGSHMAFACLEAAREVVVIDNLSTGIRALVPKEAQFVEGNVGDQVLVRQIIRKHSITGVIHFAGSVVVPESIERPLTYYANNTMVARSLIEVCVQEGVQNFIFSSTAAVYGIPPQNPVTEESATKPINPYGRSKLAAEWILEDACRAHEFRGLILRYFNVAGADPSGRTGQSTPRATHLIKRACQVALERIPLLEVFGTDYPTRDGTGVRDYIHVRDLVSAHLLGLEYLEKGGSILALNCGYGQGFSVREVINTIERITGRRVPTRESPRRPGDPAELVADSRKLTRLLGWQPEFNNLEAIIDTAYRWERRLNAT